MYDWLKPIYHFTPVENWMNDPNGLCYFQGQYHLFFQHNPHGDRWGDIHWGHAISDDLVHWNRLPIAFGPSVEVGEKHCYSGCAVIDGTIARIIYTSIGEGARGPEKGAQQWMAISSDGLKTWEKYSKNPLIEQGIHHNLSITYWRDPFVWKGKDSFWYAVISGTLDGNRGCILLYRSSDLLEWAFLQVLYQTVDYPLLECPNLIPMGDSYLLIFSPVDQIHYHLGTISSDFIFQTVEHGILDGGSGRKGYYAPNTFMNLPGNRRVMMGWLSDNGRLEETDIRGWAGAQSLPRELVIRESHLTVDFVPECRLLRDRPIILGSDHYNFQSRNYELIVQAVVQQGDALSFELLCNHQVSEKTVVIFDGDTSILRIERENSSLFTSVDKSIVKQKVDVHSDGSLHLDIFVDGSIIEICANHSVMLSARVYPTDEGSVHNYLSADGNTKIKCVEAWHILPALTDGFVSEE